MIKSRYFGSSHQCGRICVLITLYPYLEGQDQSIISDEWNMSGEKVKVRASYLVTGCHQAKGHLKSRCNNVLT